MSKTDLHHSCKHACIEVGDDKQVRCTLIEVAHFMGGLLNTGFTVSVYINGFQKFKSLAKCFGFGFRDAEDKYLIIFFTISAF